MLNNAPFIKRHVYQFWSYIRATVENKDPKNDLLKIPKRYLIGINFRGNKFSWELIFAGINFRK